MGCCDGPGLRPVAAAMELMADQVGAISAAEMVSLADALDRILAHRVQSSLNVPPHDNSGMDGYAFCAEDKGSSILRLVGTSLAGHPFHGELHAGECIRIMTGAALPDSANTVVMQEKTHSHGEQIEILDWPHAGNNVRRCGEDIQKDQIVLQPGTRLSPADLGLIASLGIAQIEVVRRARVALIATGDELASPGQPLPEGGIFESNSVVVAAMLRRLGCEIRDFGIIEDDFSAIEAAFIEADQWADVVISSGGVSVGDADYIKDVLDKLGSIGFWKLAMKPGKPFAFGKLKQAVFFGLPGNPVSASVTFHQLAVPIIRQLQGDTAAEPFLIHLPLVGSLKKKPGRRDYQRGVIFVDQGRLKVRSGGAQGSGILSSLSQNNCYIVLERACGSVKAGDEVNVLPFDRWLV